MEEFKSAMDEFAAKSSPHLQVIEHLVPCFQIGFMKFGKGKIMSSLNHKASLNHRDKLSILCLDL